MMRIRLALVAAALLFAVPFAVAAPASANATVTATSVALSAGDNCQQADLDLGITSGTVQRESGKVTGPDGTVLGSFEQSSSLSNQTGVFEGFGISADDAQPDGTILGTYAYVGSTPPSASDTAEWFVLYRCHTTGAQEVLSTCFGDYGTCPQTAPEAIEAGLISSVVPTTPVAGGSFQVNGTCPGTAVTVNLGHGLASGGTVVQTSGELTPLADSTFSASFTLLPALTNPFDVQVVCQVPGGGNVSTVQSVALTPASTTTAAPTTTTVPTTAPAAQAVTVTPAFTG
jgi:hypothetical protein